MVANIGGVISDSVCVKLLLCKAISCTTAVVHNRDGQFFSEFLIEHTPKLHLNS